MMLKGLSGTIIILIIFCSSFASASYIKADFNIDEAGNVAVQGESDVSLDLEGVNMNGTKITGVTADLTDKIKDIWKFKVNLDYDNSEIRINLPEDSNIFNIETENKFSISSDLNKIVLQINEPGPVELEFFYSVGLIEPSFNFSKMLPYIFIIVVVINAGVIYYLYRKLKQKPKKIERKVDKVKILYDTLNEKEKKIIDAVRGGADYQAKIMNETEIPKASLSRYINNLIKKGFLIRQGEGKLSKIKLRK